MYCLSDKDAYSTNRTATPVDPTVARAVLRKTCARPVQALCVVATQTRSHSPHSRNLVGLYLTAMPSGTLAEWEDIVESVCFEGFGSGISGGGGVIKPTHLNARAQTRWLCERVMQILGEPERRDV